MEYIVVNFFKQIYLLVHNFLNVIIYFLECSSIIKEIWVFDRHNFLSFEGLLFNVSCNAGLLATNSFYFCLRKYLILKDNFTGYRMLGRWGLFSALDTLNISLFLLACMVSEMSDVILIFAPLYIRYFLLTSRLFLFDFLQFEYDRWRCSCLVIPLLGVLWPS